MAPPPASYRQRLRELLRARAPSICALMVIVYLFDLMRASSVEPSVSNPLLTLPSWMMATVAVLVPQLLEATPMRGGRLAVSMVVATVSAVGLVAVLTDALYTAPLTANVSEGRVLSNAAFLYRGWWLHSATGLLFAAYCRTRDREQRALRAARDAELARADTQREIVASRLEVLRARVEPELLFEALADVRAAYLVDPAAADALLDDLVAYLRAALPQMRGGASTLEREVSLAEAYLRVVPAGRSGRLRVIVNLSSGLADTDFPPMVLLPLVHAAAEAGATDVRIVATGVRDAAAGTPLPAASVAVHTRLHEVLRGWNEDALEPMRERLAHYLDGRATLHVEREGPVFSAVVGWKPAPLPADSSFDSTDPSRAH